MNLNENKSIFLNRKTDLSEISSAGVLMLIFSLVFGACLWNREVSLSEMPFFISILTITIIFSGIITSILLCIKYAEDQQKLLGLLASCYSFMAISALFQIFIFQNMFEQLLSFDMTEKKIDGEKWLFVDSFLSRIWHTIYSVLLIAALVFDKGEDTKIINYSYKHFVGFFVLGISVACFLNYFYTPLYDNNFKQYNIINSYISYMSLGFGVLSLGVLFYKTQLRTPLYLWLFVSVYVFLLALVLQICSSDLWSITWYLSKVFEMISVVILLVVLMTEIKSIYFYFYQTQKYLKDIASHDELTGAFNRRFLDYDMPIIANNLRRGGHKISVAIFDIDHFKQINDKNGHFVGDIVLKELTNICRENFKRDNDVLVRLGGDEFVLILTHLNEEETKAKLHYFHQDVQKHVVEYQREKLKFSISIGYVAVDDLPYDCTIYNLIFMADKYLYEAKKKRNNVVGKNVTDIISNGASKNTLQDF